MLKLFVTDRRPSWFIIQHWKGTNQHTTRFSLPEEFCMRHHIVSLSLFKCYSGKKIKKKTKDPIQTNQKNNQKTLTQPKQNTTICQKDLKTKQKQQPPQKKKRQTKTHNPKKQQQKTPTTQNHYNPKNLAVAFGRVLIGLLN